MLKLFVFSHPCSLFVYLRLFGFLYLWLTRSTIIICNTHNFLDVLVCSIAEYFCELYKQRVNILGNTTHHKPNSLSIIKLLYFICKSYKAEKWSEKRSVTHATDCSKMFFFTVQNNQLYKTVRYLYSFRAIFVLFLVKLGNKSEVSLSDPFCQFLVKFTWIQSMF